MGYGPAEHPCATENYCTIHVASLEGNRRRCRAPGTCAKSKIMAAETGRLVRRQLQPHYGYLNKGKHGSDYQ